MGAALEALCHDSPVDVITVSLGDQQVAFLLADVAEVLPAAAPATLPDAPAVVRGLINLRGMPLPVLDLRRRLGLPGRLAHPDDHVVVCQVAGRPVGVWVDRAEAVRRLQVSDIAPFDDSRPGRHFCGAAMIEAGVLLVFDVESFLSREEADDLEQALASVREVRDDL